MASISDYILSGATQDALIPSSEWARRAREILASGRAMKALEEQERERQLRPTEIWPGNTFQTEDIPERPNNWLYNALSNPKLNRGLQNLAESASDVILGRESGNSVVDLGTANIPGVGAASILAAGGMPGLVDAVGAGELRNMKRIPKYTYEFVKEFFGDRGLKNLDNALTKYPKAGAANLNDAIHVLKTGLGGETVNALKPYRTNNVINDMVSMGLANRNGKTDEELMSGFHRMADMYKNRHFDPRFKELVADLERMLDEAYENNNTVQFINALRPIAILPEIEKEGRMHPERWYQVLKDFSDNHNQLRDIANAANDDNIKRYVKLDSDTPQNWEKIVADQKYLDEHPEIVAEQARKAEEEALKRKLSKMSKKERKAFEEKLRKQQQAQQKQQNKAPEPPKEQPKAEQPLQEKAAPEVKETPKGGPNMWRENGWNPNVRGDAFYGKFGGNLSDESKRDMFVLDSLANHWARQIIGEGKAGKLADAEIVDALDRADARHNRTNYNAVSRAFYEDVKKNIASGNMPGKAVTFGPKYKKNVITDRDTPTLILDPSEKPRFYNDIRIWADEQEGPDLYEMVFRPKSDEILNSINPDYWMYRSR